MVTDPRKHSENDFGKSAGLLSGLVLTLILILFGLTLTFIVYHHFFSPDEADVANLTRTAKDFSEFNEKYLGGGPLGRLIFYGFLRTFQLGLPGNQALACAITFLTFLHLLYISKKFLGFRGFTLLIPAFVFATSSPVIAFGSWGFYIYAEMILFSSLFLHLLLSLESNPNLSLNRGLAILFLLVFMVIMVIHCALPAIILLGVFFIQRMRKWVSKTPSEEMNGKNLAVQTLKQLKVPLLLGVPVLATGVGLVLYYSSPELSQPRRSLWPLYFPHSDLPHSPEGLATFISTRTVWLFRSVFGIYRAEFIQSLRMEDYRPKFSIGIVFLNLAFCIGMIRSIFLTKSIRFPIALYVLLVVVATLILSLLGFYPYGIVRYLLFLLIPILMITSFGIRDLIDGSGAVVRGLAAPLKSHQAIRWVGVLGCAIIIIPLLYWQGTMAMWTAQKARDYNEEWAVELQEIQNDRSSGMVWDYYSSNLLNYALPQFHRPNTFKFPRDFMVKNPDPGVTLKEWQEFLNSHETILCLMFNPLNRYPDFNERVAKDFRVHKLPGVRWWNLSRWERIEPFSNRLPEPSDFSEWEFVGGVRIEGTTSAQNIVLEPGGNLYRYIAWPIDVGTEVMGTVVLWADNPTRVGISIERHGSSPGDGSPRKWIDLNTTPTRVETSHRFTHKHEMVRLRLWAPKDRPATFHAKEPMVYQKPSSETMSESE